MPNLSPYKKAVAQLATTVGVLLAVLTGIPEVAPVIAAAGFVAVYLLPNRPVDAGGTGTDQVADGEDRP